MDFSPRQMVIVATLMAVPIASFMLVFRPQNAEIKRAKDDIQAKRALLTSLREVTAQANDLSAATAQIQQTIAEVESRLPNNKELDSVLRDVAQIADRCGLRVPKFVKSAHTREAGTAKEQQLEIEVTGDFDGFYQFLLGIEQMPRITRLTDMNVQRVQEKGRDGLLRGSLKMSIYYQSQTPVASAEGTLERKP